MGANMQRQAVPLIRTDTPIVATGMEAEIATCFWCVIIARRAGVVEYVSADKIIIRVLKLHLKMLKIGLLMVLIPIILRKFQRSSYSTWIHQQPIVKRGRYVLKRVIFLTMAQRLKMVSLHLVPIFLVAFMPWHGYNFEDAIILNQRLVSEDIFTSVHIDEYVVDARDTKLGPEEITRDIPNVSESMLESLDEDGIVRIGTRVKPGDILLVK